MNIFTLAEILGKTAGEIMQISINEFTYWSAYFEIRNKDKLHIPK